MMERKRKAKWQNDYIAKAYDRIQIVVPKGRKADVEKFLKDSNGSVNKLVNTLLRDALGMTEDEWKSATTTEAQAEPVAPPADEPASAQPAEPIKRPRTIEELWALQSKNRQEESEDEHIPLPWEE